MFNLDLEPSGLLVITDEGGYRLVLRPIGPTGELLARILIDRKMGRTKLGTGGAPTQAQSFNMEKEMERLRKAKAQAALTVLPIETGEIDI